MDDREPSRGLPPSAGPTRRVPASAIAGYALLGMSVTGVNAIADAVGVDALGRPWSWVARSATFAAVFAGVAAFLHWRIERANRPT